MALQGEAKKLYHREYMRRQRAGLPTRGVVKPKVMEQWCSECVLPPSPERIVVSLGSGPAGREARGGEGGTHHTPPNRSTGMRAWLKPEQHGRALVARLKTPA